MIRDAHPADAKATPLLQARDLTVRFGGLVAVDRVDFAVLPGEIVGLIGPNGAGKSTLINALTALVRFQKGKLHWEGRPVHRRFAGWRLWGVTVAIVLWTMAVTLLGAGPQDVWEQAVVQPMAQAWLRMSTEAQLFTPSARHPLFSWVEIGQHVLSAWAERVELIYVLLGLSSGSALGALWHQRTRADAPRLAQLGLLRTFQNLRLFSSMTVKQHLEVASYAARHRTDPTPPTGEHVAACLRRVGLDGMEDRLAASLAYGEMRRLEIARALAGTPRMLVLDEPAAGLGAKERKILTTLLHALRAEGLAVVLIEHDMDLVMRVCDRVVVLDHGQKIADGAPEWVKRHPAVEAAYLGLDAPHRVEARPPC